MTIRATTPVTELGEKSIPGEKHKCYAYALAQGTALLINDDTREHKETTVTAAMARRAEYAYLLRFLDGRTWVEFTLDGKTYAQPLQAGALPTKRRAPSQERAPGSAPPSGAARALTEPPASAGRCGGQASPAKAATGKQATAGHTRRPGPVGWEPL